MILSKARDLLSVLNSGDKDLFEEESDSVSERFSRPIDLTNVLEKDYFQITEIAGTTGAILDGIEYLENEALLRFSGRYDQRKVIGLLAEEFSEELSFRIVKDGISVEARF